jgi:non-specific serine/threonine protein kinase
LIDACAQLTEYLLNACPGLNILSTSRESLGLTGENVWLVPTLSLPDAKTISLVDLLMQYEGIRLFVERATAVNPGFTPNDKMAVAIAQVCRRLDGIPLAIELAAARIKTMSITEISERLDDRFQLLTVGNRTVQSRHQTLRATVDWSYDLLSVDERLLFCRLSVFSGGWTLDAAESVCSGDGIERSAILNLLARLVDKSLVIITDSQRYGMLETMRRYGNEKLVEAGCQERVVRQYLDYYLKMSSAGDEKIRGSEQMEWLKWFEEERDNLSGALEMAFGSQRNIETGCELVCVLCWYWGMAGDFILMKHWLEIALPRSAELGKTSTRAKTLFNAAFHCALGLNWLETDEVQSSIEESLELWQALSSGYKIEIAKCLMTLGWIQGAETADRTGFANLEQAIQIFTDGNNIWWHAWAFNLMIGLYLQEKRHHGFIQKALEDEIRLWDKTGDRHNTANTILDMGRLALDQADFTNAQTYLEQSLQIFREFGSKGYIFQCLESLGDTYRGLKKYEQAETCYQECISLSHAVLWDSALARICINLGYIALHQGNAEQAKAYFQQALEVCREFHLPYRRLLCVAGFASLAVNRSDFVRAARLFGAFFAQLEILQHDLRPKGVEQMEIDGDLALCRSQLEAAVFEQAWKEGQASTLEEVLMKI